MVVAFSDFHFIMGWLNVAALPNIDFMVVTLLVFQFPIVCVSCLIPLNHFHVSGFYQNDIRQTKCVECASGESYVNAKTACRACDIGTFESSKGICETCPSGFYQNDICQTKCVECALGESYVDAKRENRTSMPKQHAVLVTLVRLKAAKVFAKLVRVVFIKTTYVKQNALNVHRENRTSMPKQHAVLVTLVRLKAAKVFVKLVRPGSIKIPKV